jgi:hypothetical protein
MIKKNFCSFFFITFFFIAGCKDHFQPGTVEEDGKIYDFITDGFVPNSNTALKIAYAILPNIYGKEVLSQKPFVVKLIGDTVWHVDGTIQPDNRLNGGEAHIEIRKRDCAILKVLHGK